MHNWCWLVFAASKSRVLLRRVSFSHGAGLGIIPWPRELPTAQVAAQNHRQLKANNFKLGNQTLRVEWIEGSPTEPDSVLLEQHVRSVLLGCAASGRPVISDLNWARQLCEVLATYAAAAAAAHMVAGVWDSG